MNVDGIKNADALTEIYGQWPAFHDAEVLRFTLERSRQFQDEPTFLELVVADRGGELDAPHVVTLRFTGVRDLKLDGFDDQNVLFEIEMTHVAEGEWKTVCLGSTDFAGEWTSKSVEVVAVRPL